LLHQMQRYQPSERPGCVGPRLVNLVLKSLLAPMFNILASKVFSLLQNLLRTRGKEETLWEPLFSIVFLCLLVIGKTQVSLVEHAVTAQASGDSSYSTTQASIDIEVMEQELSVHLIGMFHARFGTNGKGNGNGRSFNPFAKDHQNPIQMSLLVQSILLAGKASGESINFADA
jgi:hypothetical protein